jgi:hypothetical protein
LSSFEKKMGGMIVRRHNHFRREPYPLGARGPRAGASPRRLPARSRAPAKIVESHEARTATRVRQRKV